MDDDGSTLKLEVVMALPNDEVLQLELMDLLMSAPEGQMHCRDVYELLATRFPALTNEELTVPFGNSVSHWANRVQFARLRLVEKGWVLRPFAGDGRGYWKVSAEGRRAFVDLRSATEVLLAELDALPDSL
jgi:hypothetical protein